MKLSKKIGLIFVCLILSAASVFAKGKKDKVEEVPAQAEETTTEPSEPVDTLNTK